jgi:hypothetical protein
MDLALRSLHPQLQSYADYCIQWAAYLGISVTVTSVLRDATRQAELRRRYELCLARGERVYPENPNPDCRYPANRPGDSAHEYGLAWDSWCSNDQMPTWVAIRQAVGWRVPENDPVHAEYPNWRSVVGI